MKYFIGTSGWYYKHWFAAFYPKDIKEKLLSYYSQFFRTVELNSTFYRLPDEQMFQSWYENSPDDFIFAVKANRYITHLKKLAPGDFDRTFLDRISILKEKLGPILFQLPPSMHQNIGKLEKFIKNLPQSNLYSFEFRHSSWYTDDVYKILQKYNIALCIHDHRDGSSPLVQTADFLYVRFHGTNGFYGGLYSEDQLRQRVKEIEKLRADKVFAYFNNDQKAFAIKNAQQLKEITKNWTID